MENLHICILDSIRLFNGEYIRFERKAKIYSFLLIYYSIAIIAFSLVSLIFSKSTNPYLMSFYNILISVVMLIYSVINNHVNYQGIANKFKEAKKELLYLAHELEVYKRKYDLNTIKNRTNNNNLYNSDEYNNLNLKYLKIINDVSIGSPTDNDNVYKKFVYSNLFEYITYLALLILPWIILFYCINWPLLKEYYLSPKNWE